MRLRASNSFAEGSFLLTLPGSLPLVATTAARHGVPPLRPERSLLRLQVRRYSSGRKASIEVPTAGGGRSLVGACRGRGRRGGGKGSSHFRPNIFGVGGDSSDSDF